MCRVNNPVRSLLLLFLTWLGTVAAFAQAPAQIPVAKITITNIGPQVASESLVRANIRVREGEPYVRAAVDDDVRNLMKTGYFLNVRITDEVTANGVNLTYILLGKPKITDITITGNKKYSDRRLQKKLTAKVGDPLDERKLFTDAEEIKKMYQKAGYPQTEVKYIPTTDNRTGRASVTFEVTETPKVRIIDVYFEGASAFPQKKLRKVIKTRRHWMFSAHGQWRAEKRCDG
jgi:outer membrane protein insertion porin family